MVRGGRAQTIARHAQVVSVEQRERERGRVSERERERESREQIKYAYVCQVISVEQFPSSSVHSQIHARRNPRYRSKVERLVKKVQEVTFDMYMYE